MIARIRHYWRPVALLLALAFFGLTFLNASWLAPVPKGKIHLIAHKGVYQAYSRQDLGRDDCTANRIYPPMHDYLENTPRSLDMAWRLGADMVELDIAPTKDGAMVVFHDWAVDCRTNGTGETRDLTLAQLKALDIGYGYTADGGKTFPFRGKGVGGMPTLEEALQKLGNRPVLFNFKSKNAAEADDLAARLKALGRDPVKAGDGFYGADAPVARIRQIFPDAWGWGKQGLKNCTKDYLLTGWLGHVPESCRGGTLLVPSNLQWITWGWPNRTIARMESVGARIVMGGPYSGDSGRAPWISDPEMLGDIPASFNGYLLVDDIWRIGPALRPTNDPRSYDEVDRMEAALKLRPVE